MIDQRTGWWFTPSSIKVMALDPNRRVLLCQNELGDWELPGGWPGREDPSLVAVAAREVREETGLEVGDLELVSAELFSNQNHGPVVLVFFRATTAGGRPVVSDEHKSADFFALDALPEPLPDVYRHAISRL
jgi:ADP-ribose pyrophosphatase YjhB (NUDIX family)